MTAARSTQSNGCVTTPARTMFKSIRTRQRCRCSSACTARSVIAIFPERSPARLALVVFLRGTSSDQLHALRDNVGRRVFYQKVNMVGCHHVVEHAKTEPSSPRIPSAGNGADHTHVEAQSVALVLNGLNGAQRLNDLNGLNNLNALPYFLRGIVVSLEGLFSNPKRHL
jgi:hypothetical protein